MPSTRLWFLRHGEVQEGMAGAFVGQSEVDLSPLGIHQAEATKEYLREAQVDAVLSSPRRRAKASVAPLAAAHGIPVRTVAGFGEMDFGDWEGLHWEQILRLDRDFARRWQADPAGIQIPGGETVQDFQTRIEGALADLLTEFKGRSVVLGGHAGTSRAILASILGIGYMDAFVFVQDYGCLNAAAWNEDGAGHIALVNFVPGPRSTARSD